MNRISVFAAQKGDPWLFSALNGFSGFLGGRAEAAGSYRFSISVSDLFAATSTRAFELTVTPAGDAEAVERVARAVSPGAAAGGE